MRDNADIARTWPRAPARPSMRRWEADARDAGLRWRARLPAESLIVQSLCETRSGADSLTIRRRSGHSPPERIWTYPLAPVSAGSRPYCPVTKPHVVPGSTVRRCRHPPGTAIPVRAGGGVVGVGAARRRVAGVVRTHVPVVAVG